MTLSRVLGIVSNIRIGNRWTCMYLHIYLLCSSIFVCAKSTFHKFNSYWGIPSSDGIPYGLAFFFCVCVFFSPSAAENGIPGGQTHGRKPWIDLIF